MGAFGEGVVATISFLACIMIFLAVKDINHTAGYNNFASILVMKALGHDPVYLLAAVIAA